MSSLEDLLRRVEALEISDKAKDKRIGDLERTNNILNSRIIKTLEAAEQRGFLPKPAT